jgi:signal peptidase I
MRAMSRSALGTVIVAAAVLTGCGGNNEQSYRVPSASMEPTYRVGEEVEYEAGAEPRVGDVVVFYPPAGADVQPAACGAANEGFDTQTPCSEPDGGRSDARHIKRVVAVGGDRLSIRDGRVILNGEPQDAPFACGSDGVGCDFPTTITVPDGMVYVLGDNRGASDDSRYWGPVPTSSIIGVVGD